MKLIYFTLFVLLVNLSARAQTASIGGTIRFVGESQFPLRNINVRLIDQAGVNIGITVTNAEGQYQFDNLETNKVYRVEPVQTLEDRNGVSTFDMLQIRQHIIGVNQLDLFAIVAADVNNSETVTTFDLVQLRQLILFNIDSFEGRNAWHFFRPDVTFVSPENPFLGTSNNDFTITLTENVSNFDFIGLKVGDVNNSAMP